MLLSCHCYWWKHRQYFKSQINLVFALSVSLKEVSDGQQHSRLRCPRTRPSFNNLNPCHIPVLVSQSMKQSRNPNAIQHPSSFNSRLSLPICFVSLGKKGKRKKKNTTGISRIDWAFQFLFFTEGTLWILVNLSAEDDWLQFKRDMVVWRGHI